MNILITGGYGMLGTSIRRFFSNHKLLVPEKKILDVANFPLIKIFANEKIDMIFHLAALTDLQNAQKNPKENFKINVIGTKNILWLAGKLNVPVVFISSAMVFDGKKKSYTEKSTTNPQNNYGIAKKEAEQLIRSYNKHYILRNGWSFGGGPTVDKKFVNKIYQKIKEGSKKIYGITDIYGSPTYTNDFTLTLKNIIEQKADYGTYHVAGKGVASRFEVLNELIKDLGKLKKIETVPLTLRQYLKLFPTPFPYIKHEVLSIRKIEKQGLSLMRDWRETLKEYVKELEI